MLLTGELYSALLCSTLLCFNVIVTSLHMTTFGAVVRPADTVHTSGCLACCVDLAAGTVIGPLL